MIRLAIRMCNYGAMQVGGDIEISTHIVDIDNARLEKLLEPQENITKNISVVHLEVVK